LGFVASILFVVGGVWMLYTDKNAILAWACVGFFGASTLALGYTFFIKIRG
jgi:hypothetical protein